MFHVTARVNWQAWFLTGRAVRVRLVREIAAAAERFDVGILAWVLMANHFHVVCQSPPERLFRLHTWRRTACRHWRPWPKGHQNASVIARFMKQVRRSMAVRRHRELGVTGQFWQGPYDARAILDGFGLVVRIAYDHRNPVEAGLVRWPEECEWSSARAWATQTPGLVPITDDAMPLGIPRSVLRAEVQRYQARREVDVAMRALDEDGLDWSSAEGIAVLRAVLGGGVDSRLAP